jgi:hypothetical protein
LSRQPGISTDDSVLRSLGNGAFYSAGSRNITIDNNKNHDNYMYAIDLHSSTSDMSTTNNYYIDHNRYDAIICSEDCSNFLI